MNGQMRKHYTYYRCQIHQENHGHLPWYADHPANILVREDLLLPPVARFFTERVFGANRKILLAGTLLSSGGLDPELEARRLAIQADIIELRRRQTNLVRELESFTATGDPDIDDAWRSGIQTRFAATIVEQRTKSCLLADLTRQQTTNTRPDLDLIDALPVSQIDITGLPEHQQRHLYDAFHLEVRYHAATDGAILRITIDADTAPALARIVSDTLSLPTPRPSPETAEPAAGAQAPAAGGVVCHVRSAPGGIRTHTEWILSPSTLPLVYRGSDPHQPTHYAKGRGTRRPGVGQDV